MEPCFPAINCPCQTNAAAEIRLAARAGGPFHRRSLHAHHHRQLLSVECRWSEGTGSQSKHGKDGNAKSRRPRLVEAFARRVAVARAHLKPGDLQRKVSID